MTKFYSRSSNPCRYTFYLEIASETISEGINFQISLRDHAPRGPVCKRLAAQRKLPKFGFRTRTLISTLGHWNSLSLSAKFDGLMAHLNFSLFATVHNCELYRAPLKI